MHCDEEEERRSFLPAQREKKWDLFPDSPREMISDSMVESKWYNRSLKFLHISVFILTFVVVLGTATISKGSLLFMASQVSHNQTKPYCNEQLDVNRQFVVTLPITERVAWIWFLFFAYCIPQVGIFLRSVRICIFKSMKGPMWQDFALVMATETFPAIGSALLVFGVLPHLDVLKGAMLLNGFCFVPALLNVLMSMKLRKSDWGTTAPPRLALDCFALAFQTSALVAWPFVKGTGDMWLIPAAILCIASGYWENFYNWGVDENFSDSDSFWQRLARQRIEFPNTRYFIYAFVSCWKMLVFFATMLMYFWIKEGDAEFLFDYFDDAMGSHPIVIREIAPIITSHLADIDGIIATGLGTVIDSDKWTPFYVFLVNVISTYVCYIFGKFACKILIQGFSYAFPINLTMPFAISILIAMCGAFAHDPCAYSGTIPPYLFFDIPSNMYYLERFLVDEWAWVWLLWILSQAWVTRHIWMPTSERLARTERLYMRPMYDPFLIDQDIALNRRREAFKDEDVPVLDEGDGDDVSSRQVKRKYDDDFEGGPDKTTRIYACGTMWHETKEEMMAFLKSVIHLDADQCARKICSIEFNIETDYYELETHVFFDDAFVRYDDSPEPYLNDYVMDMIGAMDEARRDVHEVEAQWPGPVKISTPYGGRLIWKLPGGTRYVVHLKDKKKIRAKKRWSQVMYMYYLLGHRLMNGNFLTDSKVIRSENTFLLALDGDIDFQPNAVLLLVDLMKKSKSIGACCGRIHPIGSGPMVWYQIFEYAIGHWLQKATEHVIGCVLCSPGCFSLFRGSALMEDNVMKKYTTEASEARHFVQYDQGEDRWLCTLLLQRGFRVEYSAASDAYTHAPEGFNEFFNQRRRWMPSTTANIFDLLMDYKFITHTNDNISMLYILYQGVMMIGTVLGPGTIFLMLVGAFVAAFKMDQWDSFLWNAVPILIFMATCKLFAKADVQLFVASALSAVYGLVMMAVLVGVMMQIQQDGILAPSSLFFFFIAGEFVITALLHPKEVGCLMYGVIYYVTVPSMYLLLVIYSVFNMNVISWGTRETVIVTKKQQEEAAAKKAAPQPGAVGKIFNFLGASGQENSGNISFAIANLFRCVFCTVAKSPEEERLVQVQASLEAIQTRLGMIEKKANEEIGKESPKKVPEVDESVNSVTAEEYEELNWWMDEGDRIKKCETGTLTDDERTFWRELVEKYLKPDVLPDDSKEKLKIKKDLEDMRDKSVASFFMINALFVLVVFLLTLKKDILHLNWPFNVKTNFTYNGDTMEIIMQKEYLELEPIGFVFLIFFGILMVVQFLAMFQHRFETMCQILANMEFNIGLFQNTAKAIKDTEKIKKGQIWIDEVKRMQRLKPDMDDDDEDQGGVMRRRTTVLNNSKIQERQRNAKTNLLKAFKERFESEDKRNGQGRPRKKNGVDIEAMRARRTVLGKDPRKTEFSPAPPHFEHAAGSGGYDNPSFVDDDTIRQFRGEFSS